jgi:hypothetical protein
MLARNVKRGAVVLGFALGGVVATAGIASAAPSGPATGPDGQFLCPAVGAGVANADVHNGDHAETDTGTIASGQETFLPGNNQAGAHVNDNALNSDNPGTTAGPGGGNRDWSPLWPGEA